ncbi:hypothetical protein OQZ33_02840 [Pedobacter sp. MC2016-05]|uniref:hypothetical protein n=1 Tax=Pedobacter sp. MC2016-05 TaxID=2994474 RepID=UPI002247E736|nr:hypothetical protein [Pedobacter sp. MC2016-05]MCX2473262.1 hypothetical protein [Pedobacter sp. MC2016-05]
MDYICTWICTDAVGEESIYPQTGEKSSGKRHQDIYWRCILLFFATSKRFNKSQKHVLFSNTKVIPQLDGREVLKALSDLDVEIIYTEFKYKTPKGYFNMFQNQFYEFSILEYIVENNKNPADQYLILDSDCIFTKGVESLFSHAKPDGFVSFEDGCTTDLVIHGLSRKDMKLLYEDLLGEQIDHIPGYHLGEFFLASVRNINTIFSDFQQLWPELLRRHRENLPKFNEEAQTLSYLYFKNNFKASEDKTFLKRIWTNPVFYRNVEKTDLDVAIWHLPAEKTYGLSALYQDLILKESQYGLGISNDSYLGKVKTLLGIPELNTLSFLRYYLFSYYRAVSKRLKKHTQAS